MNRYSYEDLKAAALSPNATPADLQALADWFSQYDMADWNGEYFEIDSNNRLFPIYGEEDECGDIPVVGWEVR